MYKTKEIRWFFEGENKHVLNWFDNRQKNVFDKRKDFYLHLKNDDIGVKLRDGNIEIKHRVRERARGCLYPEVTGYFENWVKWSFGAEDKDPLYTQVLNGNHGQWIEITKERFAVVVTEENGKRIIDSQLQDVEYGCQIEYTKVHLLGGEWHTFGLEWFGETCLELESNFMTEILQTLSQTIYKPIYGLCRFLDKISKRSGNKLITKC